jgi:hypothetical protein
MNDQIRNILSQNSGLEDDLHQLFQQQQVELNYRIEGTKARFEESIKKTQRELRAGFFRFFWHSQFRNFITSPIIYSIIFPVIILDPHRRYVHFADFGQAENYVEVAKHQRSELRDEKD